LAMQRQIHKSESKLAHLPIRGAEIARALHLLKQLFGNRFSGLPVAREQVQRIALPGPVLHDLRWQFHEIPRDAGAREATHFNMTQNVMQQMAEFVEN